KNLLVSGYDFEYFEQWTRTGTLRSLTGMLEMNDTDPEIERKFFDMIMARSGEERFMMGVRSFDAAREIVLASLPKDLPHDELSRRLFVRIYGASIEEIVKQTRYGKESGAFGWLAGSVLLLNKTVVAYSHDSRQRPK